MDIRKQQKYSGKDYSDVKTVTVKPIGKGADGVVHLANYTVQKNSARDDLKILTANDLPLDTTVQLAVKTLTTGVTANPEEVEIVGHLFEAHKTKKQKNEPPPNFIPTVYDHKNARFLSPFVNYDADLSSNLQEYLMTLSRIDNEPLPYKDTGKALTQFVIAMKDGQDAMLDLGVFHNDISTRNLIVKPKANGQYSATLTDFGQARFVGEDFSCTFKDEKQVPIRYLDPDFIKDHKATITTHLYMRRAAILECAGNMLGAEQYQILSYQGLGSSETAGWVLSQAGQEDAITKIFSHYRENFDYLPPQPRAKQVQQFIECFKEYLTRMPSRNPGESPGDFFWRAQKEDDELLLAAYLKAHQAGFITADMYSEQRNAMKLRSIELRGKQEKIRQQNEGENIDGLVKRIVNSLQKDYEKAHPVMGKHTTDLKILETNIIKARMESSSDAEAKNKITEALMDYCGKYMRKHKYQVDSLSEMVKRVNNEPTRHAFLRSLLIQIKSLDTRPELTNVTIAAQLPKDSTFTIIKHSAFTKFFKPKRDSSEKSQKQTTPEKKKGHNLG